MFGTIEVRDANVEDADTLGEIHVLAWQHAYRGLMPDDYLDGLSIDERRQMWRRTLRQQEAVTRVLVASRAGELCGFAVVGPVRDADLGKDTGELYAINVHPDAWRQGIGRELVVASVAALTGDGYRGATLWVLVGNDRARRFYEVLGWRCEGLEKRSRLLGAETHEIRYRIDL
jgi:ribosomal protein S18 acetylase RimI-like enzyme